MNENTIKYNDLLKSVYEKALKPAGFCRYGGNFRRFYKSQIFTTGLLVSFVRYGKEEDVSFAVLLGKKSSFNGEPSASFRTSDCPIPARTYLTELSENSFRRFVIDENTDVTALTNELCSMITEYALPWFSEI